MLFLLLNRVTTLRVFTRLSPLIIKWRNLDKPSSIVSVWKNLLMEFLNYTMTSFLDRSFPSLVRSPRLPFLFRPTDLMFQKISFNWRKISKCFQPENSSRWRKSLPGCARFTDEIFFRRTSIDFDLFIRSACGPLLSLMKDNFQSLVDHQGQPSKKLFVYSGHDTTLIPLAMALEVIKQSDLSPRRSSLSDLRYALATVCFSSADEVLRLQIGSESNLCHGRLCRRSKFRSRRLFLLHSFSLIHSSLESCRIAPIIFVRRRHGWRWSRIVWLCPIPLLNLINKWSFVSFFILLSLFSNGEKRARKMFFVY